MASVDELGNILRFPIPVTIILGVAAYAVIFILFSGVLASIYRLAALGEDRPGLVHLRMDGPAKRVFFAFLVLALINAIVWGLALNIGLSLAGNTWADVLQACGRLIEISAQSNASGELSAQDIEGIAAPITSFGYGPLIAALLSIYINIKLVPFAAGSAVENRLWLFGSLARTTGHFWSIIGISILLFLLILVIAIIFQIVMMVVQLLAVVLIAQGSVLAIVGAVLLFAIFPASIWYGAFTYALQFGLPAIIYRRLTAGA